MTRDDYNWEQVNNWFDSITHMAYDAWGLLNDLQFASPPPNGVQTGIAIGKTMSKFNELFDELDDFKEFLRQFPHDELAVSVSANRVDLGSAET